MTYDINDEGHFDEEYEDDGISSEESMRRNHVQQILLNLSLLARSNNVAPMLDTLFNLVTEDEVDNTINELLALENSLRNCLQETDAILFALIGYDEPVPIDNKATDLEASVLRTIAGLDDIDKATTEDARKEHFKDQIRSYGFY